MSRRGLLLSLTSMFVALLVLAAPVIADELLGVITKVDVEGKKLTILSKEDDKDVEITVNDKTEYVGKDGATPIDLEKVAANVKKRQDAGKKGINVKVTHEKGVASKIEPTAKKKAAAANSN
jgi:biopolymer transport protein ExbD